MWRFRWADEVTHEAWIGLGLRSGKRKPTNYLAFAKLLSPARDSGLYILPALTHESYLNWIIFQGSITTELFLEFVRERVLPYCSAYPRPRSGLILDNCNTVGTRFESLDIDGNRQFRLHMATDGLSYTWQQTISISGTS